MTEHNTTENDTKIDRYIEFMREAIAEARQAGEAGDVPVGAVIVIDNEIVGRGRNRRQERGDPTAHAEVEALRAAATQVGNWRIEGTLFVTQEPCPMCAGAIVNARVKRLVYGCANPKAGAIDSLFQIATDPRLNHRVEVCRGLLSEDCGDLLRRFFSDIRQKKREL